MEFILALIVIIALLLAVICTLAGLMAKYRDELDTEKKKHKATQDHLDHLRGIKIRELLGTE